MAKRLIDWFNTNLAVWVGICNKCNKKYTHNGTQPTQTNCRQKNCDGTIMWQIDRM